MRSSQTYRQLTWDEVTEDTVLPTVADHIDVERVIASAASTWTLFAGHTDPDYARNAQGRRHIYMPTGPILGLLDRYITGWAGPETVVAKRIIRMTSSICAGDDITFHGRVTRKWLDDERQQVRPLVAVDLHIDDGDGSRRVTGAGVYQLPRAST